MIGIKKGHAVAEFSLILPLFFFISGLTIDLANLTIQQILLEHACRTLARRLALLKDVQEGDMGAVERELGSIKKSFLPTVHFYPVPQRESSHPHMKNPDIFIFQLNLQKTFVPVTPFMRLIWADGPIRLSARTREMCLVRRINEPLS